MAHRKPAAPDPRCALREDAHQARTDNGPAVAAVLRNTAIGFHRSNGEPNIADRAGQLVGDVAPPTVQRPLDPPPDRRHRYRPHIRSVADVVASVTGWFVVRGGHGWSGLRQAPARRFAQLPTPSKPDGAPPDVGRRSPWTCALRRTEQPSARNASDVRRLVFTAGACPLDEDGVTVAGGDVAGQAEQVMANLRTAPSRTI
jgi:enamine deaminase RidA (YjgF/YER057c/UK114 family)